MIDSYTLSLAYIILFTAYICGYFLSAWFEEKYHRGMSMEILLFVSGVFFMFAGLIVYVTILGISLKIVLEHHLY